MRFRLGLVLGFGAGYYLGARAGRERYEQLNQWIDRTRNSEVYETATEKARAVVDLATERARDLADDLTGTTETIDLRDEAMTPTSTSPTRT